jgi:drug/metabolite transporter (DMT)-like permease
MNQPSNTQNKIILAVVALTVMWGTNWGLFPLAVKEVSVWTFRAISLVSAAGLVLAMAKIHGYSLEVPRRERLPIIASALCYMFVWHIASTYAAIMLPSGQAAVLGFTMPIWTTLISWLIFGEKPLPRHLGAVLLAGMGIGSLAYSSWNVYASAPLGFLCGLSAGLGWAIGTLILHRSALSTPAIVSTGWQFLVAGTPITMLAWIHSSNEFFMPSWTTVVVIGYITLIPLSLGNIAWFQIANTLPANISGISTVMVPMLAMITGAVFLNEPLGILQIIAMLCSASALALALKKES